MDQEKCFEIDGKTYRQTRAGRWIDSSCMQVIDPSIIRRLNEQALALQESISLSEQYKQAQKTIRIGEYDRAMILAKKILDSDASRNWNEKAFSIYVSSLRHMGHPDSEHGSSTSRLAIKNAEKYIEKYPYLNSLPEALTSLASCWADLAEYSSLSQNEKQTYLRKARSVANQVNRINGERGIETDGHLINVYKRIKRLEITLQ